MQLFSAFRALICQPKQPCKTDVLVCERDGYMTCIRESREHKNAIMNVCGMEEAQKARKKRATHVKISPIAVIVMGL